MNGRILKILSILILLILSVTSCKKKSSTQKPYYPGPGIPTGGSGTGGYSWSNGNLVSGGGWYWTSSGGWVWSGTGAQTSKPPSYVYPPGQSDPDASSTCYAKGENAGDRGSFEYYRMPIIGHGKSGGKVWSSSELPTKTKEIFTTDSRFNIRIVANKSPDQNTPDYKGVKCGFEPLPYSKISLTIGLSSSEFPDPINYYNITDIPVGGCSKVFEFSGNQIPVTSGPLIVTIYNFKTNYPCNFYEGKNYSNNTYWCPYYPLLFNDCFSIELQFSTDYTLDIPGPRAISN